MDAALGQPTESQVAENDDDDEEDEPEEEPEDGRVLLLQTIATS